MFGHSNLAADGMARFNQKCAHYEVDFDQIDIHFAIQCYECLGPWRPKWFPKPPF